jgi:RND family efflux transporter MFP subunit
MMKRTVTYVMVGVLVVAAVIGTVVWRSRLAAPSDEDVRSVVVDRGTMLVTVLASGSVEPRSRVEMAFEVPGQVAEVPVKVGDRVKAGDVLARLDSERLALQVQQARASLESARAQLAQLRAGARPEEVMATEANLRAMQAQVSAAAANLDQLESGASDAQVAAAEADLASSMAQQKVAYDTHERTMKCVKIPLPDGSKRKICPALGAPEEQARYNLQAADKTLAAAQARLDQVLEGTDENQIRAARADVWAAAAQRDAAQARLDLLLAGAAEEQIAIAEAQVAQAQLVLESAELTLKKAALYVPFDGVVAIVNAAAGERVAAGLPVVAMVDDSTFHVTVAVDEMDVGRLVEEQTAQVTLDSLPDVVIPGTVERIAPAATLEGGVVYYDVVIELAPTDAPIRADMTASATIVVEELADVLTIPTWVVRVERTTGRTYVHRQVGDDVERVEVELGVRYEGVAQVLDGLSEADVVVWVEDTLFDFGRQDG